MRDRGAFCPCQSLLLQQACEVGAQSLQVESRLGRRQQGALQVAAVLLQARLRVIVVCRQQLREAHVVEGQEAGLSPREDGRLHQGLQRGEALQAAEGIGVLGQPGARGDLEEAA